MGGIDFASKCIGAKNKQPDVRMLPFLLSADPSTSLVSAEQTNTMAATQGLDEIRTRREKKIPIVDTTPVPELQVIFTRIPRRSSRMVGAEAIPILWR